jgi:hypothetical protein
LYRYCDLQLRFLQSEPHDRLDFTVPTGGDATDAQQKIEENARQYFYFPGDISDYEDFNRLMRKVPQINSDLLICLALWREKNVISRQSAEF